MKIEEAKKFRKACIYALVFPNGKKYVGKTKDLSKRMGVYERFDGSNECLREAIDDYGWEAIDIEVLMEVSCRDAVDLDICLSILEVKYIRDMGTISPNGYNISVGGECLGIPIEYITTDADVIKRYNDGSKSLLLYDECGDFVREYPSISKCAYDNGWDEDAVRRAVGRQSLFYGKYFIRIKRYDYVPKKIELPKGYEIRERVKYKNVVKEVIVEKEREVFTFTPALKYDMNGDFCGEYKNKSDAVRTFSSSRSVGWGEYHNGYIVFKKRDDNIPEKIEPYHILSKKVLGDYYVPADELDDIKVHEKWGDVSTLPNVNKAKLCIDGKYTNIKHRFKVFQCKLSGEVVKEYDSIRDAAIETGIQYSQIYNCLRGATKRAAGYVWKKEDDGNNNVI